VGSRAIQRGVAADRETSSDPTEPLADPSDDPLEALRLGDTGPFEAFVVAKTRSFFAYFRRLGAGTEEAEDLTQELFVRLHRSRARYRSHGRVQAYCLRVGRNVWVDRCRRRGVRPDRDGGEQELFEQVDGRTPEPATVAAQEEANERCRQALHALPTAQREVVRLSVLEGLTHGEVSAHLDVPVGTVKSRLFYGLRRLAELLHGERTP